MKTKQQKRIEALERAKAAKWENSKAYRRWLAEPESERVAEEVAIMEWVVQKDEHIQHLQLIVDNHIFM